MRSEEGVRQGTQAQDRIQVWEIAFAKNVREETLSTCTRVRTTTGLRHGNWQASTRVGAEIEREGNEEAPSDSATHSLNLGLGIEWAKRRTADSRVEGIEEIRETERGSAEYRIIVYNIYILLYILLNNEITKLNETKLVFSLSVSLFRRNQL